MWSRHSPPSCLDGPLGGLAYRHHRVFRHLYRIEETLEKAVAAELLPRELCGLGFGFLACANAAGAMAPSLYVGYWLEA